MLHLCFCVKLYLVQIRAGRYFLHEHPNSATSWDVGCMRMLLNQPGVLRVRGDMCPHGMTSVDEQGEGLVKKPTRIMSSSAEVLNRVQARCSNERGETKHRHVHLVCGRPNAAEIYPPSLVRAILEGLSLLFWLGIKSWKHSSLVEYSRAEVKFQLPRNVCK